MSKLTTLNLSDAATARSDRAARADGRCPRCRSPKTQRETVGSFGTNDTQVLCGNCGYEFKEPDQ